MLTLADAVSGKGSELAETKKALAECEASLKAAQENGKRLEEERNRLQEERTKMLADMKKMEGDMTDAAAKVGCSLSLSFSCLSRRVTHTTHHKRACVERNWPA